MPDCKKIKKLRSLIGRRVRKLKKKILKDKEIEEKDIEG